MNDYHVFGIIKHETVRPSGTSSHGREHRVFHPTFSVVDEGLLQSYAKANDTYFIWTSRFKLAIGVIKGSLNFVLQMTARGKER